MMIARGLNLPLLMSAGILVLYAWYTPSLYAIHVLTVAGIYALATIGYHIIFGMAGALSLAQGTFYGIGAYTSGLIALHYGWGLEYSLPIAIAVPVAMAMIIGISVMGLDTHYLALATLCFAQIILLIAIHWQELTGGANGLSGIPGPVIVGYHIELGLPYAGLVWMMVGIGAVIASRIQASGFGLALGQSRDNYLIAECFGLRVKTLKVIAFMISAAYAGAAGSLMVHNQTVVSPEFLSFFIMVTILSMAVIGGRSHSSGAIIGALLLIHLPEWLREFERSYLMWYGMVMLLVLLMAPTGIIGLLAWLRDYLIPEAPRLLPTTASILSSRSTDKVSQRDTSQDVTSHQIVVPAIVLDGISKKFGAIQALDDLHLTLHQGCITGIMGPNGSGKTTLLNVISGVECLDSGSLYVFGKDMSRSCSVSMAQSGISRSFQNIALPEEYDVLDAIAVAPLSLCRNNRHQAERNVIETLERWQLIPFGRQSCATLAPGVRQRVGLARAMSRDPKVLLLDEPTIGLTNDDRVILQKELRHAATSGTAVVIVDHDMGFLQEITDRLICLHQGHILADGAPAQTISHPEVIRVHFR